MPPYYHDTCAYAPLFRFRLQLRYAMLFIYAMSALHMPLMFKRYADIVGCY